MPIAFSHTGALAVGFPINHSFALQPFLHRAEGILRLDRVTGLLPRVKAAK